MEKTVIKGKLRANSIVASVLIAVAAVSCSRPSEYYEFQGNGASGSDISEYVFNVPFDETDATYDSFIAFRFSDAGAGLDTVPVTVKVYSPTFRFGLETLAFRVGKLANPKLEAEFPYRSGIRVAQDTGIWRISISVDTARCSTVTGIGFRYKKREK